MKSNNKINNMKNAAISGVKKAFEEMAFIDVDYIEDKKVDVNYSHILFVNILEPLFGKMALYLPYECKRKIIENIYSKDMKELHADETDDCQLELLNVLVGNILSFLYKKEKKYKLDLPKILFDENEISWNKKNINKFYFNAEGFNIKLLIDLKN